MTRLGFIKQMPRELRIIRGCVWLFAVASLVLAASVSWTLPDEAGFLCVVSGILLGVCICAEISGPCQRQAYAHEPQKKKLAACEQLREHITKATK